MDSKIMNKLKDKWLELKGVLCPDSSPLVINKYEDPFAGFNLIEVPTELYEELNSYIGTITYICVYATYITVKCDKKYAKFYNQEVYIGKVLDKLKLTRWDNRLRRLLTICRFYAYDNALCEFRLPRYALGEVIDCIEAQNANYRVIYEKPYKSNTIDIPGVDTWVDRAEQVRVIEWLSNPELGSIRGTQLFTGGGKLGILDSLIKIPNGWKRMGDIELHDEVITRDGSTCLVTGVFPQGEKDIYRVTFRDNRYTDVGLEHLWLVYNYRWSGPKWKVINTQELIEFHNKARNNKSPYYIYVPLCESEKNDDIDLPIHPYLLGTLLGDGSVVNKIINITTDHWIVNKLQSLLPEGCYFELRTSRIYNVDYCGQYILRNSEVLWSKLKELELDNKRSWEKFIPDIYLRASHNQRMELIRGLMDTDGCINKPGLCRNGIDYGKCGTVEFTSASKQLTEDLQYLIRSIGGMASMDIKEAPTYTYKGEKLTGRPAYRIKPRVKCPKDLFHLPRKKDIAADKTQYSDTLKLSVKSIEYVGKKEAQCISVSDPSGLYITDDFIVTHNTACAIRSSMRINKPTLIICSGLQEQWLESFLKITKLKEDDIFTIQGHPSIVKLFKNEKRYKVYIASIETLRSWIYNEEGTYEDVPTYTQFLEKCEIGIKVVDEFHLNFNAIAAIDFRSNVEHNIYLSATPERSDKNANKIFNIVFPKTVINTGSLYNKYVNATMYAYHLDLPPRARVSSRFGYSHSKYESIITSFDDMSLEYFRSIIKPIIDSHYFNKFTSGKLLILTQTIRMAEVLAGYIKYYYPQKDTRTYLSSDPESNLKEADIIVSTPKSAGVGTDIKELVCMINTVSVSSEPLVKQMFGRLRKLPDGRTPEYVDIYNKCIPDQNRHKKTRAKIYKYLAKEFIEFTE